MRIFCDPYPEIGGPFAVCIGKFDGLHIGHRKILGALLEEARAHSAVSAVYSFEPRNGAPRLSTTGEKGALFASLGIGCWIQAELSEEFMLQSPELFIERLAACGELRAVAVGADFRFGRGAAGDAALLGKLGGKYGFAVQVIPQVRIDDRPVSSTWIRECVLSGDMETAALLLGREYSLSGEVVRGRQLGERLGFKTANLLPPEGKLMPANGVYAAYVDTEAGTWPAMTNVGVKPTVDGGALTIESNLLGFAGDLYGKRITVRLVGKIRDEIKFGGLDGLKAQLKTDSDTVRNMLGQS
jgi:riboflavin kinase/FMN adenylyltransferase